VGKRAKTCARDAGWRSSNDPDQGSKPASWAQLMKSQTKIIRPRSSLHISRSPDLHVGQPVSPSLKTASCRTSRSTTSRKRSGSRVSSRSTAASKSRTAERRAAIWSRFPRRKSLMPRALGRTVQIFFDTCGTRVRSHSRTPSRKAIDPGVALPTQVGSSCHARRTRVAMSTAVVRPNDTAVHLRGEVRQVQRRV